MPYRVWGMVCAVPCVVLLILALVLAFTVKLPDGALTILYTLLFSRGSARAGSISCERDNATRERLHAETESRIHCPNVARLSAAETTALIHRCQQESERLKQLIEAARAGLDEKLAELPAVGDEQETNG
ncbi:unnamed protein product [Vitrella brassicaformis CCMP3155]|uniref:Uncharacterized protein n=1 Tax=Vitrella brassicaformis (strain CCMP3155) TaxID=1169540 RepID=A0A0G4EXP0_VITBC|nr:unnamed protein product [Vitrella brassicaformis CCMP3155]|eukprot:CEM04079.1 unnamed protein product [Vitrella brassicaformis CCMP3155]